MQEFVVGMDEVGDADVDWESLPPESSAESTIGFIEDGEFDFIDTGGAVRSVKFVSIGCKPVGDHQYTQMNKKGALIPVISNSDMVKLLGTMAQSTRAREYT